MKKALGVVIIVFALAIVITPQFLNCNWQGHVMKLANGGTTPMLCFWSAHAEIAVGVPILAIGSMMLPVRTKEALRYLGVLGAILGVFVILIPQNGILIGVCKDTMVCTTVMRPSLRLFGSVVVAASLGAVVLSLRKEL